MAVREPTTGRNFDLRNSRDQKEVKRMVRRDCPTVLIVSPPCTAFSIANQGEVDKKTLESAVEMIRFSIELCELQHKSGRHFIFEQPQSSRAWSLNEVVKMTYCEGVGKTTFHQCMYGLETRSGQGTAPCVQTNLGSDQSSCPDGGPSGAMPGWPQTCTADWEGSVLSSSSLSTGTMLSHSQRDPGDQKQT
jgi:hypothetical protein